MSFSPDVETALKSGRTFVLDLAERVLSTFVVTAASVALAAGPGDMFTLSFWQTVGVAGLAAVGSLLKGVVARVNGFRNSASSFKGV